MAYDSDKFYETFGEPRWSDEENEEFLFETFGEDLEVVQNTDPHLVWTVIEGDETENQYLVPGIHYVNSLNYIIMDTPWTEEQANGEWAEVLWVDADEFDHDEDDEDTPSGPRL